MNKHPKRTERPGVVRLGRNELHDAALDGDARRVAELLAKGRDPAAQDDNGWTPLHFAVQSWAPDACLALLEAGAPVDARDSNGNTPLWRAVLNSRGRGDVIKLLRDRGADPTLENNHGVSPLKLAGSANSFDVKQFFKDLLV